MRSRRDRSPRAGGRLLLYALAVVAIVVAVLAITEIGPPTSSARTSKEIVTAAQGVVQSSVSGTGNIAAGTDDTVNFTTSGTLQDVYVHVGQHVNSGQLLADLDPTSAQLTLNQANASLTAAQDNLNCVEGETSYCGSGGSGSTGSGSTGSGSSSTTSYSPSTAGTIEYASFTPPAGTKPSAGKGNGKGKTKGGSGTTVVATKTTPSVTVTVVVPSTSPSKSGSSTSGGSGSSGAKSSSTPDHDDHQHPLPGQHRLGAGVGLLRAGQRPQRRGRAQRHQALRPGQRHDRLAVQPYPGPVGDRRVGQLFLFDRVLVELLGQ